jgi:DNA primase catalytic subunit
MDKIIESNIKKFDSVDFAAKYQKGYRNNIIPVRHVPCFIKKFRAYECYTTYFLFSEKINDHMIKNHDPRTGKSSVSGYKGPVYAYYLPIDIDSDDLEKAWTATKILVKFLLSELVTDKEAVLVAFSGNKGFHVMIDTRIFGQLTPSENLHIIFSSLRERLVELSMVDKSVIDLLIKDKVRLIRLPNTVNRKSGLYKIQLSLSDLFRLKPFQIHNKARKPQQQFYTDRSGLIPLSRSIKPNSNAQQLYGEAARKKPVNQDKQPRIIDTNYHHHNTTIKINQVFCKAEQVMATNTVPIGQRNNSAIRVISKIKVKGFSQKTAEGFIRKWNRDCKVNLPDNELMAIVRSVYSRVQGYAYGCNDEILKKHCKYEKRNECIEYRIYNLKRNEKRGNEHNKRKKEKTKERFSRSKETKKRTMAFSQHSL